MAAGNESDCSFLNGELVHKRGKHFPSTLTPEMAKNPFFQARLLCHDAIVKSHTAEISKIQSAVLPTQKILFS